MVLEHRGTTWKKISQCPLSHCRLCFSNFPQNPNCQGKQASSLGSLRVEPKAPNFPQSDRLNTASPYPASSACFNAKMERCFSPDLRGRQAPSGAVPGSHCSWEERSAPRAVPPAVTRAPSEEISLTPQHAEHGAEIPTRKTEVTA